MLDGDDESMQTQMAATGMQSSDFVGRTHQRTLRHLLSTVSCRVHLSPTTVRQAESVHSHCSTTDTRTRTSKDNPPHIIPLPSPLLSPIPPLPPTPTQPPHPAQSPCARPAPTATSFACDSPTKSVSRSELRLLQLRPHFHFTCAQRTRFNHVRCRRWQAEGEARSGLLAG
jgi:hypothetical protein